MSRNAAFFTAASLASFPARFPSQPGTVTDLQASGTATDLHAAGVKDFSSIGKLQWLKAKENFFVQGALVPIDDYVQVPEDDARRQVANGRAVTATDEEVAAARTAAAKAGK